MVGLLLNTKNNDFYDLSGSIIIADNKYANEGNCGSTISVSRKAKSDPKLFMSRTMFVVYLPLKQLSSVSHNSGLNKQPVEMRREKQGLIRFTQTKQIS